MWLLSLTSIDWSRHAPGNMAAVFLFPGLYAVIMTLIASQRVTVQDDRLILKRLYVVPKEVHFSDITHSDVQVLAERDWPVMLTIHTKQSQAPMVIGLKAIRREDAAWLCELPCLKPVLHPGLTKRKT